MKRILSVLLVLVMVLSMIPVIASAAETSVEMNIYANQGTMGTKEISWTSGAVTFKNRQAGSSTAIRTSDSDHFRLYASSAVDVTCSAGNITKIVVTATSSSYATVLKDSAGAEATASGSTVTITLATPASSYTIAKMTAQSRIKKVVVTYADASAAECEHTNTEAIEALDPTCTVPGNTAGVKCADCGAILEGNEAIPATGHTEDEGVVTAPTCVKDGYTLYTCSVCGNERKEYIDATGHNYVDGVCSGCGLALPTNLAGQYYIAAIRKEGNYWYMTNDVGTASTLRYQIVDSGVTTLPESIENVVETQLFELVAVEGGYVIKTGDQYLGWSSGNSGILVDKANAKVVTIEYGVAEGSYNIHFTAGTEVRYLSLNSDARYAYYAWYTGTQINDLHLVPVGKDFETEPDIPECIHDDTEEIGAIAPSCTKPGNEAGEWCNSCESYIKGGEEIPVVDHTYVNGTCSACGAVEVVVPSEATITFDDAAKRTQFTTDIQVWEENGVKVTNNKASSTSNVGDYVKPARFYKSSTVTVEYPGMTKIVFNCNNATYATDLSKSITGATVSVDGTVVTVELASAADSFTTNGMNAQVRVDSLTVYTTKLCAHVWGEAVLTTAPACAVKGENTYTCTLCGETKTEAVAALGHIAADGFCSVCGGEFYALATSLNEGDSVVLFNPENEVAMGVNVNSYGDKMLGVATDDATGLAVTADMAVMQVQYVNETDFYLVKDGKYLTTGATGNSLVFADEANDYSIWYLEVPFEGDDVVLITNRNAVYNSNAQSIEYYNSAFTAYSRSTGKNYQMKLYVKAAPVPSVEITHISLNPAKDALGYKAEAQNLPEGAHVEISLWVNENIVVTKATDALRLVNIMACNGGEMTIYAKATIVDAEGKVIAESAVAQTTMKETIKAVNALTDLTSEQKAAVGAYYEKYQSVMSTWFAADETNNIVAWIPTTEESTPAE